MKFRIMFVIDSKKLKTLLNVDNKDMICDLDTAKVGDLVSFFHNKEVYEGKMIKYLDPKEKRRTRKGTRYSPSDYNEINPKKVKKTSGKENKSGKSTTRKKIISPENSDDDSNISQPEKKYTASSSDDSSSNTTDTTHTNNEINSSVEDQDEHTSPKENKTSGTKDAASKGIIEGIQDSTLKTNNTDSPVIQSHNQTLDDDTHLFGAHAGDMVHLKNNIYVKKRVLNTALRSSSQATHIVRQLLEGVVKPEILCRCTLTGKPARGKKDDSVLPIHGAAKDAIIGFATETAKGEPWRFQDMKEIERAISQKLTEIRLQHKINKPKN